jgi:hypothetical protein
MLLACAATLSSCADGSVGASAAARIRSALLMVFSGVEAGDASIETSPPTA